MRGILRLSLPVLLNLAAVAANVINVIVKVNKWFTKTERRQCRGTVEGDLYGTLAVVEGTVQKCEHACLWTNDCTGFIHVFTGALGGKCYLRQGALQMEGASTDRDCYEKRLTPQEPQEFNISHDYGACKIKEDCQEVTCWERVRLHLGSGCSECCAPMHRVCMVDSGKTFLKVYQIPATIEFEVFPLNTAKVGDIAEENITHLAKLADAEINALAEPLDGYSHVYMLRSEASDKWTYVQTNSPYTDTQKSFGISGNARICLGDAYSGCSPWTNPASGQGIDNLHTSPRLSGQDCNRYLIGYRGLDCWKGARNTRCVSGGAGCRGVLGGRENILHGRLKNFSLWLHVPVSACLGS